MTGSPARVRRSAGVVCALFVAWLAPAPAGATGYVFQTLLLEGDPDPRGGTVQVLYLDASIAGGRVQARGTSSAGEFALYRIQDGVVSVDVAQGDPAPGSGGDVFSQLARPVLAGPDVLAHTGIFSGQQGGFLHTDTTHQPIALPGDVLAAGGTVTEVARIHSGASGPWIALGVSVDAGGTLPDAAHLVQGPSGLREVYRQGSPAPASVGGMFWGVSAWDQGGVAADGALTFAATVEGGSADSGIFRGDASGTITPLLLWGDVVTTPGGGSYSHFWPWTSVNAAGDVAYQAELWRYAFPADGIFVLEAGVQREIVYYDDPLPGAPHVRYLGAGGSSAPVVDAAGRVAFVASFEDTLQNEAFHGVVVHDGDELAVIVRQDDPVPGVPGATFTRFDVVDIDEQGRIAFSADTNQGRGIFLATPAPQVPALPPWGPLGLAALLAAGARRRSRSVVPRAGLEPARPTGSGF